MFRNNVRFSFIIRNLCIPVFNKLDAHFRSYYYFRTVGFFGERKTQCSSKSNTNTSDYLVVVQISI